MKLFLWKDADVLEKNASKSEGKLQNSLSYFNHAMAILLTQFILLQNFKRFTHLIFNKPIKGGIILISDLQLRKLKERNIPQLVEGNMASKC